MLQVRRVALPVFWFSRLRMGVRDQSCTVTEQPQTSLLPRDLSSVAVVSLSPNYAPESLEGERKYSTLASSCYLPSGDGPMSISVLLGMKKVSSSHLSPSPFLLPSPRDKQRYLTTVNGCKTSSHWLSFSRRFKRRIWNLASCWGLRSCSIVHRVKLCDYQK